MKKVLLLVSAVLYCVGGVRGVGFLQWSRQAENQGDGWWTEKWFPSMPVDHFSFGSPSTTFPLRYLTNTTYWKPNGTIFFYAGNEGDIQLFAANTGLMWDLSKSFGAMVVFAEHRYYGKTQPFGKESLKTVKNRAYLSSEQALADYAVLIKFLKDDLKSPDSPVIVFGGSYGGMLAAWFRIKYPHIVDGALAASAPILQFAPYTPCWTYSSIVTKTFRSSGPNCDASIRRSWTALRSLAETSEGRSWINSHFHLCNDSLLGGKNVSVDTMVNWLSDVWNNLPMIDYPYSTNFLNPVPAWPVKAACKFLDIPQTASKETLLTGIYNALSVYMNYTGQSSCYKVSNTASGNLAADGWGFQACSEMVMPMCNTEKDMFEPNAWNLAAFNRSCFQQYGVYVRPNWVMTNYGGEALRYASNIVFSNGLLDPWSGGGYTRKPLNDKIIVIKIKNGAHHYDLRASNKDDTVWVKRARALEVAAIKKWINGRKVMPSRVPT